jgi:hypothetical protein
MERRWIFAVSSAFVLAFCACSLPSGCVRSGLRSQAELPAESEVRRERLIVHSNFPLPQHHRLLDELVLLHDRVVRELALPDATKTIDVYLFETAAQYRAYVDEKFPTAPERRACFVHNNDSLCVYAQWSDFIAIDLRHEVTHGYLHAILQDVPLWLDEGIAEYFEVDRDARGFNLSHRRILQHRRVEDNWRPNLQRIEQLDAASEMGEMHYAESWAWVHYLLRSNDDNRQMLQDYLARLRMTGEAPPMSQVIGESMENAELRLLKHLRSLQP